MLKIRVTPLHRPFPQHKAIKSVTYNPLPLLGNDKSASVYCINDAQITVSNSTQWGHYRMLSPCTIKRSLIRRLPPQYAAHARDLLSNSQGAEKTSGPRGRLKNRAPRQSITARQLMYLGHRNGLREPEPGYETQRGGCTGGGQHPLRPGTSRAEHRGGGARGGGREAAPLWAPRWDEGAAGSGDPVGAAAPQLPLPGPVGRWRGRPPRQPGSPATFPRGGSGVLARREKSQKNYFMCIYIYVFVSVRIYIYIPARTYIFQHL